MSEPFIGEIRSFGFNFAPRGWAMCNGQLLPISQNTALFAILGTSYGGNGTSNFALPNLQGRVPVHVGPGIVQGQTAGVEAVTLTQENLPTHDHNVWASADFVTDASPKGDVMGAKVRGGANVFAAATNLTQLAPGTVGAAGSDQPHDNMQPCLVVTFCIALVGIFPSRN